MTSDVSGRKHTDRLISKAENEAMHGNYGLAENLLKEAVRELERALHVMTTDLAVAKHNLIAVLEPQGKIVEASVLRNEICELLKPENEP